MALDNVLVSDRLLPQEVVLDHQVCLGFKVEDLCEGASRFINVVGSQGDELLVGQNWEPVVR